MKSIYLSFSLLFAAILSYGQEKAEQKEIDPIPDTYISETNQSVKINGTTINLRAKTGTMLLRNNQDRPVALFGYTSYVKEGNSNARPIIFAFNGGPGSASVWLHIGALGPKRIIVNAPENTPPAPYQIVNNEYSVLDIADLVLIDPVGTGFSVAVGESKNEDFWSIDGDIKSIGLFIKQFLIENNRLNSPKFLLGESYGTFRNAGLMKYLFDKGIALNGVIMVSAVLDIRTILFAPNDNLPYVLYLPSYAAAAWYHNKIDHKSDTLEPFLAEVRDFAQNEYAPALFKGDKLSTREISDLALKLQEYTGIHSEYWIQAKLKVKRSEFLQELLRDEGYTVDRLDSRIKGINQDLLSQTPQYEPLFPSIDPAFTIGFLNYLYTDLKVDKSKVYCISANDREDFKWNWSHKGNMIGNIPASVNTGIDMATTMTRDPNVKVLILQSYFDNGTIFYGMEYTLDHLELPKNIKKNISVKYYKSGHMMYIHEPSLKKFKSDISEFIQSTVK
jgi:carboxypeptidase C (cathepsin A)